jgi:hypothetical protein
MLAIEQLSRLGVTRALMRNQLRAERWVRRTDRVVGTTTGELTRAQLMWLGVLHVGNGALVGGLTAAGVHGLRNWERDQVTILVPDDWSFDPVPRLHFFRTRRPLGVLRAPSSSQGALPVCRLEPAVLLFGGYDRSPRTAQGVVAACVQQRLTSPDLLRDWIVRLRPLRRSGCSSVRCSTSRAELSRCPRSTYAACAGRPVFPSPPVSDHAATATGVCASPTPNGG